MSNEVDEIVRQLDTSFRTPLDETERLLADIDARIVEDTPMARWRNGIINIRELESEIEWIVDGVPGVEPASDPMDATGMSVPEWSLFENDRRAFFDGQMELTDSSGSWYYRDR